MITIHDVQVQPLGFAKEPGHCDVCAKAVAVGQKTWAIETFATACSLACVTRGRELLVADYNQEFEANHREDA